MDIYAQNIMDHYKNPRNVGELNDPKIHHAESNYSCGDSVEVSLKIENNTILDMKFKGGGCAISQASISILSENIIGKNIQDVLKMTEKDIVDLLGVTISYRRKKCALLGLLTIKNAILSSQNLPLLKWTDIVNE